MALVRRARPIISSLKPSILPPRRQTLHTSNPFDVLSSADHPLQIYLTSITDPYLNLSVEHHLLQRSHPSSTLLFIYANRPCVVIGRNQNPWVETDLARVRAGIPSEDDKEATPISLVRRRSGGGAVFHDAGNTNWTVICPPANFTRTKHAEMVTRALRRLGVDSARVNERHDIVVSSAASGRTETPEVKVSGSAYKLTRLRALHHGTCLLGSPHLTRISGLLRSPAAGYIKARGVESVRSPIANVGRTGEEFAAAVRKEFDALYPGDAVVRTIADGGWEMPEELRKGYEELESRDWIYGQTPQFTFSTRPSEDDPRERPEPPESLPRDFRASFTVRHGKLQDISFSGLSYREDVDNASQDEALTQALDGQQLHQIEDWTSTLSQASPIPLTDNSVGKWLNQLFGL